MGGIKEYLSKFTHIRVPEGELSYIKCNGEYIWQKPSADNIIFENGQLKMGSAYMDYMIGPRYYEHDQPATSTHTDEPYTDAYVKIENGAICTDAKPYTHYGIFDVETGRFAIENLNFADLRQRYTTLNITITEVETLPDYCKGQVRIKQGPRTAILYDDSGYSYRLIDAYTLGPGTYTLPLSNSYYELANGIDISGEGMKVSKIWLT